MGDGGGLAGWSRSSSGSSHLFLQVMSQVDVLRRVGIVQQLSVTRVHQVDAEVQRLLLRTLRDHVGKLCVLQNRSSTWVLLMLVAPKVGS